MVTVEAPLLELPVGEHFANRAIDGPKRQFGDEATDAVAYDHLSRLGGNVYLPLPRPMRMGVPPSPINHVGSSKMLVRPIEASPPRGTLP